MDDFLLILDSKETCKKIKKDIELFIKDNLKLELNHKSRYYPHRFGINFCGYIIFTTHMRLRRSSKTKIKRKISNFNKLYKENKLNLDNAISSINSWLGHAKHANTYTLRKKIIEKCEFLYTNNVMEFEDNYLKKLIDTEENY